MDLLEIEPFMRIIKRDGARSRLLRKYHPPCSKTKMSRFAANGSISALLSLILATAIGGEQIVRLNTLRRAPAGSFLGALVRPFSRKLFT